MTSSVSKGRALELGIVNKLRDAGVECEHTGGPGDMGIDIKGVSCDIPFVVQCKNWTRKNIGKGDDRCRGGAWDTDKHRYTILFSRMRQIL
nr:5845_t:CDS:2 [Entrophospora candida]